MKTQIFGFIKMPDTILDGKMAELIRRNAGGSMVIRLAEDAGAYKLDDEMTVGPGEWKELSLP